MQSQNKEDEIYAVILKYSGVYHMAFSSMPDLHKRYETKEEALLAARRNLKAHGQDPGFVLDLTNAQLSEVSAYLK